MQTLDYQSPEMIAEPRGARPARWALAMAVAAVAFTARGYRPSAFGSADYDGIYFFLISWLFAALGIVLGVVAVRRSREQRGKFALTFSIIVLCLSILLLTWPTRHVDLH